MNMTDVCMILYKYKKMTFSKSYISINYPFPLLLKTETVF